MDIFQFISNLIVYGEGMGFRDRAFEELFLMFVKVEVPEALSGISRFNGHVDRIFSALSDLVQGDYESEKCRIALRSLIKPAFENISVILNKIRSLFLALYHITHASMPFAKKMARSEQQCKSFIKL